MSPSHQSIPVVDLSHYTRGSESQRANFVRTLGTALTDLGFFAVENHGVESGLIDRAYGLATAFFELPEASKRRYEDLALKGQRGFISFGREHAKDSNAPDLKEFWHVGRELPPTHALADTYPRNLWPAEIPEFKPTMLKLFGQLEASACHLLEACALFLGEPKSSFAEAARDGDSILRIIHYPEVSPNRDPASIRAAAHEDINFITLLCEATTAGLELLQRDGTWRPIQALRGQIIVDAGDMLQNLTNGILRSTTHRVVNPDNDRERRFSMPFFVHPRAEVDLSPLPGCIKRSGGEARFPRISAGDFLQQRLREIGLT